MSVHGDPLAHALTSTRLIDAHKAIHDAIKALHHVLAHGEHGEQRAPVIHKPIPVLHQDTGERQPAAEALEPESAVPETPEGSQPAPADDFDPARYRLGVLCKRGHDWQGTGKSLHYLKDNYCWQCDVERKRTVRRKAAQAALQEG
jgi:hypothetical protein